MSSKISRREFLAVTTTTALAGCAGNRVNTAKVVPKKVSPNEKLNVAGIGVGGKGHGDIRSCGRENVVALCDVDWNRAAECFYNIPKAKQYKDYRKMLEEMPEIDAVTVSTPDHTHAPAAYMAMKLGKHVYVQKPLTQTIREARLLRDTAREMGVATQMGNQGHCGDGVRELCEMLWSGAIGDVKECHIWTNRPVWPQAVGKPSIVDPVPDYLDWDLWLGTAPFREYVAKHPDTGEDCYCPFVWRGWHDYGAGALGDMGCHIMDPANWSLKLGDADHFGIEVVGQEGNNDQTFPKWSIIKYSFPARADMGPVDVFWYDGGKLPERPTDIPAGEKLGDDNNGSLFIGTKGYLTAGEYGGEARVMPDAKMKDYKKPDPWLPRVKAQNPYLNWLEACKGGEPAASNFDYAGPFTEVVLMGNVALRAGRKLEWDAKRMEFKGDNEATQLVSKEYRSGWDTLPV